MIKIVFILFLLLSNVCLSAVTSSDSSSKIDTADQIRILYQKAENYIDEKNFQKSLKVLKTLIKREDLSGLRADIYNLLGYSYRKLQKPDLDKSFHVAKGLKLARNLLVEINDLGLPAGTEFLDVITPQFIADLISWGAIGARTTESQIHRELASGLSMPVGFKNGTDGNVQIAIDAIGAGRNPHHFLSVTKQGNSAIINTTGNDTCHLILRGSNAGPNYDRSSIMDAQKSLTAAGVNDHIMVDCSHGNSRKDHTKQPQVALDISEQIASGSGAVMGVMIESHLRAGKQNHQDGSPLVYGQSITDACLDWESTEPLLDQLATSVRARRTTNA